MNEYAKNLYRNKRGSVDLEHHETLNRSNNNNSSPNAEYNNNRFKTMD